MHFYSPSMLSRLWALIFFILTLFLVWITIIGLQKAEGGAYLLVLTTAVFPLILIVVSTLRLAVVMTRKVSLGNGVLHHRQLFKDHRVPLHDITQVEAMEREDDTVVTLRIRWSGPHWYLDHRSVEEWEEFVAQLRGMIDDKRWVPVDSFEPLESP